MEVIQSEWELNTFTPCTDENMSVTASMVCKQAETLSCAGMNFQEVGENRTRHVEPVKSAVSLQLEHAMNTTSTTHHIVMLCVCYGTSPRANS